jgi:hypothetical protein
MISLLLCAAAAAVFLFPMAKVTGKPAAFGPPSKPKGPSYQEAIANLALVRLRLNLTDTLTDPERKAIDALTLALVAGSDKE